MTLGTIALSSVVGLLAAFPLLAKEATLLDAVVVKGDAASDDRTKITTDNIALPAGVTRLTADQLDGVNVSRDISNIFRRVPGVMANNIDQGDTGNGFRMRGFATQGTHGADTAVYIDGVPQNMPSSQAGAGHGPAYLEWLTPAMIERVDVIKGPVSAQFGDQNRAGAVDIRTRSGGEGGPSSLAVTLERYGGRRYSLDLSQQWGEVGSLFIADRYRTDSFRHDGHLARDNLFWKLSRRIGDGEYSVRLNHYDSESGAAGYLLLSDLRTGRVDPRSSQFGLASFGSGTRTGLVLERRPADGEAGLSATVYAEDFERVRGTASSAVQQAVGSDDRRFAGARVANSQRFDNGLLVYGADLRHDRGDAMRRIWRNGMPTTDYVNNQDLELLTYGVFAQAQYRPTETLKFTGGLRHDRFDYDIVNRKLPAASTHYRASVTTPKLGVAWTMAPRLELYANAAQGFRSPAAEQLSGSGAAGPLDSPGGRVFDVDPTKVTSYDLGFNAAINETWSAGIAGYQVRNEDEIVNLPDGTIRAMGRTTRVGYDLETTWRPAPGTSLYASYGRIAVARSDNPLPNQGARISVPEELAKAGIEQRWQVGSGRLRVNADAFVSRRIPYYAGTPLTTLGFMPTYVRYDLRASYDWDAFQLSLFAILQPHRYASEAAYSTAAGLLISPQPRVHVGTTLRYSF
jgi:outer membrane receptor protein involved in Fe transport